MCVCVCVRRACVRACAACACVWCVCPRACACVYVRGCAARACACARARDRRQSSMTPHSRPLVTIAARLACAAAHARARPAPCLAPRPYTRILSPVPTCAFSLPRFAPIRPCSFGPYPSVAPCPARGPGHAVGASWAGSPARAAPPWPRRSPPRRRRLLVHGSYESAPAPAPPRAMGAMAMGYGLPPTRLVTLLLTCRRGSRSLIAAVAPPPAAPRQRVLAGAARLQRRPLALVAPRYTAPTRALACAPNQNHGPMAVTRSGRDAIRP